MSPDNLLLGVDGGGSKTVAWLAVPHAQGQLHVIGRGRSGSSNCRSVGMTTAKENLRHAIHAAFSQAQLEPRTVQSACLALAGADRVAERTRFREWADNQRLADRLWVTNDAVAVLYGAAKDGIGVALISGTGSIAIGRNAQGHIERCGGWGGLIGDEGSGYQIGLAALRAGVRAADGRSPMTELLPLLLQHFQIRDPSELIPIVYGDNIDRSAIARLSQFVFQAAQQRDEAAEAIIEHAADELSLMVRALSTRLELREGSWTLAISGGILLHHPALVEKIRDRISPGGREISVASVCEPVAGALQIAAQASDPEAR